MSSKRPILAAFSDPEMEKAVLGCCMAEDRSLQQARVQLTVNDFSLSQHRLIFQVMLRLSNSGVRPDLPALDSELASKGELERAGGTLYLSQILEAAIRGTNISHYCTRVKDKARRRSLGHFCEDTLDRLSGPDETEQILSLAHEKVLGLRFDIHRSPLVTAKDAAQETFEELDRQAANPKTLTLCLSGIKRVDSATGGFRPKEQIVICGETSHGKTILAQQIVRETSQQLNEKQRVLVFSPEMHRRGIMRRHMAASTGISTFKLRRPWMMEIEELVKLKDFARDQDPRFIICDERPLTFERIRAVSELAASRYEIVLIVIDYVQLVHYPGKSDLDRDTMLAVDTYTLADNLDVPVVLLSQLTKPARSFRKFTQRKNPSQKDLVFDQWQCRPTRWDIKGHGALGETPHIILGIHRHFLHLQEWEDQAKPFKGKAEICMLKMRDGGSTGTIPVSFNENTLVLGNLSEEDELVQHSTDEGAA